MRNSFARDIFACSVAKKNKNPNSKGGLPCFWLRLLFFLRLSKGKAKKIKMSHHPSTHTQFLDLTNGEGGERHPPLPADHHHQLDQDPPEMHYDDDDEDDGHHAGGDDSPRDHHHNVNAAVEQDVDEDEFYDAEDDGLPSRGEAADRRMHQQQIPHGEQEYHAATAAAAGSSSAIVGEDDTAGEQRRIRSVSASIVDPNTPGKVVEAGQEHTGRWTKEEHEAFLSALQMYGKEWKKVAAKVKTRTVVQTRTHAQKYFQKLQKSMDPNNSTCGASLDDDGPPSPPGDTIRGPSTATTQKSRKASGSSASSSGIVSTAATTTGPLGFAAPSGGEKKKPRFPSIANHTGGGAAVGMQKQNRRSSSNTLSAAHVISSLNKPPVFTSSGGLPTFVATGSSSAMSAPPRHGFSSVSDADGNDRARPMSSFPAPHTYASKNSWMMKTGRPDVMKIVVPDRSSVRGFPEPSPAATGKRKLAEIAAARMLAGVASVEQINAAAAASAAPHYQQHPDEAEDGPPTPPPTAMEDDGTSSRGQQYDLKDAPPPPLYGGMPGATNNSNNHHPRPTLSLQIVNPATLGITYQEQQKRRRHGMDASPVTPWDGQLEALVSEKAEGKAPGGGCGDDSPRNSCDSRPSGVLLPVCGPGDAFRRNLLHRAVCDGDVESVSDQLEVVANRSEGVLMKMDDAGYCPLHTACALGLKDPNLASRGREIVILLLGAGADASQRDADGNNPLHWAARSGDGEAASKLLMKNCPMDGKNNKGETPLHWAMRSGRRGADVVEVLLESGARVSILNNEFRRPVDVGGYGFLDEPMSLASIKLRSDQGKKVGKNDYKRILKETLADRRDSRANLLIRSAHSRTLVLHHPECLEHHPKSESDWEAPDRIRSIMRRVLPSSDSTGATETSGVFPHEITVSQEFDRAKLDLLSRVHSTEYLSFVNQLSKDLERQLKEAGNSSLDESDDKFGSPPPVVPFTPLVQRSMIKIADSSVKLGMNSDTSFSAGSLKAARRAAGAVQHAVDW